MWYAYRPVEGEELLTSALLELVDGWGGGNVQAVWKEKLADSAAGVG